MRIGGSRTDGLQVDEIQWYPVLQEMVGPPIVVCGLDIPWFMEVG